MTTEGIADTITGIFTLGNRAVDQTWLLTSLRHEQSLFALPGGMTTIERKVPDVFDAERVAGELRGDARHPIAAQRDRVIEIVDGLVHSDRRNGQR